MCTIESGTRDYNDDDLDANGEPPNIPHEVVRSTIRKNLPKEIVGDEDDNDNSADNAGNANDAGANSLQAGSSRDNLPSKVELRVRIAYGGDGQRLDHAFRGASVIGICYEISKEETLNNVLHKVCMLTAQETYCI